MPLVKPPKLPRDVQEHMSRIYEEKVDIYEGLNRAQDYNSDIIKALLKEQDFRDRVILDLGTGMGKLAIPLARKSNMVYALDKSKSMLKVLKKKIESKGIKNIRIINSGFNESGLPEESVDVIVSLWAFPTHSDDWERDMKAIRRLLKKDGSIIIFETVRSGEFHRLSRRVHDKEHNEVFDRFNRDMHEWLKHKGFKRKRTIDIFCNFKTKKNMEKHFAPFFGHEDAVYFMARNITSFRIRVAMLVGKK